MKEKRLIGVFVACSLVATRAGGQEETQADYKQHAATHFVEQLSDDDAEVRRRAAYILGRMGAPAQVAVPALVNALSDRQMETRWYAIDALGQFESQAAPAVPEIIKSLESTLNDDTVRRRGARTLGRIGKAASDAVPVLQTALESDSALYRIAAAAALWRIEGDSEMLSVIAKELKAEQRDIAFFAAMAVAELPAEGRLALLNDLVETLKHSDPTTSARRRSVRSLPLARPLLNRSARMSPHRPPPAAPTPHGRWA